MSSNNKWVSRVSVWILYALVTALALVCFACGGAPPVSEPAVSVAPSPLAAEHSPSAALEPHASPGTDEATTGKAPTDGRATGRALPPVSEADAAAIIARSGTGLDRYRLTDARWLSGLPVVVNEDFDFAMAMSMDGIGAGLAAQRRQQNNARKAELLATASADPALVGRLDALRACGVHVYGLLWGASEAELLLVVDVLGEVSGENGRPAQVRHWTRSLLTRPLESPEGKGHTSWAAEPRALGQTLQAAAGQLQLSTSPCALSDPACAYLGKKAACFSSLESACQSLSCAPAHCSQEGSAPVRVRCEEESPASAP